MAAGLDTDHNCGAGGIGDTVSSALCAAVRDGGWPIGSREEDQDMTAGLGQKTDESKASTDGQAGGGAGRDTPSWQPIDLRGVIAGECRPAVPTLLERTDGQCLLYPGLTHSLHGEPESAKSLLMQAEAAVRINRGEAVLYLDFESDKESVVARLLELGAHPQAILDHFHYVRPEVAPDSSPQEQAAWEAVLSVQLHTGRHRLGDRGPGRSRAVIDQQRRPGRVEPDGAAQDRRRGPGPPWCSSTTSSRTSRPATGGPSAGRPRWPG